MGLMSERTVWIRHSFRLGKPGDGGDWSEERAVSHAVEMGRTLCGVAIPYSRDGRWMREEWFRGSRIEQFVSCRRCMRRLEAERANDYR